MPQLIPFSQITVPSIGGTSSIDLTQSNYVYFVAPAAPLTLTGSFSITATGTPTSNMILNIVWCGGVTSNTGGALPVNILGTTLTDAQALTECLILASYNPFTSSWFTYVIPNFNGDPSVNGSQIVPHTISATQLQYYKITTQQLAPLSAQGNILVASTGGYLAQLAASGDGYILIGDGTDLNSVVSSGDVTVSNAGVFTIGAAKVLNEMIADNAVTASKLSISLQTITIVLGASFESGEQSSCGIKMAYPGTVIDIYAMVEKALTGTDAGTLTPKNNAGTSMTVTTPISFPASTAINTAQDSGITANNSFVAGDIITLNPSKTTVGGKLKVTLTILRS